FRAVAGGEVLGRATVWKELPDVEAIVGEKGGAVLNPATRTVGRGRFRAIVLHIPKAGVYPGGQVEFLAGGGVERVPVFVLKIGGPLAVGRPLHGASRTAAFVALLLEHELAPAGGRIDQIVVGKPARVIAVLAIRAIVDADGARAVVAE